MEKINLLLVGGGGHCNSVIESIESTDKYNIIGISDLPERIGETVSGYKIITSDKDIPSFINSNKEIPTFIDSVKDTIEPIEFSCLVTIGQIKTPVPRINAYQFLKENNLPVVTIIDSRSIISKRAIIGEGTVILRQCFINSGVTIGVNCIINSRAMIEHDSTIGDHVHVSTGAIINGDCVVGNGCFIGSGAIISNGVSIVDNTLIGAGSVVLSSIKTPGTYLGNPARRIK